jgi:SAM-dependent methyltransferase
LAEIGCAEGFVLNKLRSLKPELHFTGMDIDISALKRGRMIHEWLTIQQATIYHVPYKSRSFDLVMCLEVIEHLEYPKDAIAELMRITRRYCLFSVPHEPFFRMANFLRGKNIKRLGDDPDHRNHWGRVRFIKLLRASGFVILKVRMPFPWLIVLTELNHDT